MENAEEVLQLLERFTKLKQKEIPRELEDYLSFVARTGDTVYRWPVIKHLFREKLIHVIKDFHDNTPSIADLPICPNVDLFNYERMKRTLLERLDAFNSAPFTVQRICELLTEPRKQYTRIDKFMRAVEKNILVVSTQEPGRRRSDSENGDSLDSIVNGDLEVNVDIEMDNEAFGIDSNEMVSNSAASSAAVVPPTAEEVTTDISSAEPEQAKVSSRDPMPDITTSMTASEDSAAVITKDDEQSVDTPTTSEEPPEETSVAVSSSSSEKVEAIICKDDSDITASSALEDKTDSPLSQATDIAIDAVDSAGPPETERPDVEEPIPKETTRELHSTSESQMPREDPKESQENEPAPECSPNSLQEQTSDDGQRPAKVAKLAEEALPTEPNVILEVKEDVSTSSSESLEQERDEISSSSTTDSSGSSVSVDSESQLVPVVDDTTTSEPTKAVEAVTVAPEVVSQPEVSADPPVVDNLPEVQETNEVTPVAPTELAADEVPSASSVVPEPEVAAPPPGHAQEKLPIDVELEPTAPPFTATDEMETASSTAALIPENVMATDDEDTNAGAPDPVVPMAAEISDATKTDDNAMDIDESSVEPMDQ